MKSFKQHTEGSFWGRDDLVKKWSTPKKDRHLYIKLAKDDASGHHRASMKRKGNEKKIADLKSQGYKEVPFESYEELQQCIDESLKADIARIASEFPERSTVTYKGKKATVLGNGKDYVKIGIGDETHEVSPNVLKKDTNESEKDTLDESKLTLSTPMYNAIMKMGLPQLMKKHDARVDRKETDKEHTTLSGERGFGTEVSKLIKQNASKLKKILSESVVEGDKLRMVNKDGDIRYVERDKVKKYQEKGYRADTKSAVEKSGNISRTDAFANVKRIAKELQKESPNRYSPLQMAKAKKEREERRKKSGDSERNRYQRLKQRAYGNYMGGLKDDFAYIEATLEENYRTLATKGMGTETPSSANNIKKNDIEMDYYDASGSKRRGKISNIDNETYTVRDLDDGKYRKYKFLDREKAKEYLKKENINENDMSLDDIKKKWAKEIIAFQDNGKDLPSSAMSDFYGYRDSDSIKTDDPDEFDDFVMGLQMGKYREALGLKEASAKADAMKAIKRDRDFQQVKDVDVRATTADMKLAKKNPIVQLRKILDYKGGTMEFLNKKKLKLKSDEADALLRGFDSLQKVQDKEKYQLLISKDPASLKKILKIVKR